MALELLYKVGLVYIYSSWKWIWLVLVAFVLVCRSEDLHLPLWLSSCACQWSMKTWSKSSRGLTTWVGLLRVVHVCVMLLNQMIRKSSVFGSYRSVSFGAQLWRPNFSVGFRSCHCTSRPHRCVVWCFGLCRNQGCQGAALPTATIFASICRCFVASQFIQRHRLFRRCLLSTNLLPDCTW